MPLMPPERAHLLELLNLPHHNTQDSAQNAARTKAWQLLTEDMDNIAKYAETAADHPRIPFTSTRAEPNALPHPPGSSGGNAPGSPVAAPPAPSDPVPPAPSTPPAAPGATVTL